MRISATKINNPIVKSELRSYYESLDKISIDNNLRYSLKGGYTIAAIVVVIWALFMLDLLFMALSG
jgi:hypothetical protein